MGSRTWIKVYCDKWLSGTLREESSELRGVWIDLLALAGSGLYGDTGEIRLQNGIGLTNLQLQKLLNISKYQWLKSKKRLQDTERIAVNNLGAIRIINWSRYQSEYERQRVYRNLKLQPKVTQEKEIEKEKEIENPNKFKKQKYGNLVQR